MKGIIRLSAITAAITLIPLQGAPAAGFAISAKSVSALGNAFSGTTAQVEDASVAYNNPAGMAKLDGRHLSLGLHTIHPEVRFDDNGSNTPGVGDSAGKTKYVPNLYYVTAISDDVTVGLAIYSPFGLGLDYGSDWSGRYFSTRSDLKTLNISPSLSFKASERFAIGVGIDVQYLEADLRKQVDFGAFAGASTTQDGTQTLTGEDWATGFTLGLLYDLSDATRLGLTFHSATRHDVDGDSRFDIPTAALANVVPNTGGATVQQLFSNSAAAVTLHLPEQLSIGLAHDYSDRLTLMADLTYTHWSRYQSLSVELDNNLGTVTEAKNWENVWRAAVGANYRLTPRWQVRGGLAYDASPVPAGTRDPRVPDNDRRWYTLGANYTASESLTVDAAVAYLEMNEAASSLTDRLGHTLVGDYSVDTLYLCLQANLAF